MRGRECQQSLGAVLLVVGPFGLGDAVRVGQQHRARLERRLLHRIRIAVHEPGDDVALRGEELRAALRDGRERDRRLMVQPERRGVRRRLLAHLHKALRRIGGRDVYLIFEPMAAAIGCGIDVEAPEGQMIVDIGGGSTEIAVISLGGIVSNNSIRVAGDELTADIQEYMARQHNMKVGERMAERIKINVGSALTDLGDEAPEDYLVHGPDRITALPKEVSVCYQEIAHSIDKTIAKIETAVLQALENTPPELYADIVKNGIWLTGGGALLRGLAKRFTDKIHIPFHVDDDPLHSVAKGTGIALKNVNNFQFLMR